MKNIMQEAVNAQMWPSTKGASFCRGLGQAPQENFIFLSWKTLFAALLNNETTNHS